MVVIVVVSTYGEDAGHAAPRCGMDFVREAFLVGKNTIALVLFWIFFAVVQFVFAAIRYFIDHLKHLG